MSSWRVAVKSLHASGGGPLPLRKLDTGIYGIRRARELGLMYQVDGIHWKLTEAGRLYAEGRAIVVDRRTGKMGRGGCYVRATWLASLPPTNEIRLHSGRGESHE